VELGLGLFPFRPLILWWDQMAQPCTRLSTYGRWCWSAIHCLKTEKDAAVGNSSFKHTLNTFVYMHTVHYMIIHDAKTYINFSPPWESIFLDGSTAADPCCWAKTWNVQNATRYKHRITRHTHV